MVLVLAVHSSIVSSLHALDASSSSILSNRHVVSKVAVNHCWWSLACSP